MRSTVSLPGKSCSPATARSPGSCRRPRRWAPWCGPGAPGTPCTPSTRAAGRPRRRAAALPSGGRTGPGARGPGAGAAPFRSAGPGPSWAAARRTTMAGGTRGRGTSRRPAPSCGAGSRDRSCGRTRWTPGPRNSPGRWRRSDLPAGPRFHDASLRRGRGRGGGRSRGEARARARARPALRGRLVGESAAAPLGARDPGRARAGRAAALPHARAAGSEREREHGRRRISATRGRAEAVRAWPRGTTGRAPRLGPTIELRSSLPNA